MAYTQGKIYKLVLDDQLLYVGSTILPLNQRLWQHKGSSRVRNLPLYKWVREQPDGWSGIKIQLLEDFPCQTRKELLAAEARHIQDLRPLLNKMIPYVSREQRLQIDRERARTYYYNHRDAVIARVSARYYERKQRSSVQHKDA